MSEEEALVNFPDGLGLDVVVKFSEDVALYGSDTIHAVKSRI